MTKRPNRRQFLRNAAAGAAGVVAAPYFVRPSALGLAGGIAASERIVMAAIGTGGKGQHNSGAFMDFPEVQMVAVCDVDSGHLAKGREQVNKKYGNEDCVAEADFRRICERTDIDAVHVSTPDHWHALASIAALRSGKDVYCEKPLANSVAEGRAICTAAEQNKRLVQTGSQERSGDNARFACELVRSGRIGKLHTVHINLPCDDGHHKEVRAVADVPPPMMVPEALDYDFWLGHTPVVPYTEKRCHFFWRFILNYGGGEMTDRGAHVIDIGQLGMGTDDTGPVEIECRGTRSATSMYDVFWDYEFVNTYANGVKMIGKAVGPRGVKFEGSDGWIMVHIHGGRLEADPATLLEIKLGEGDVQLGRSPGHHRNFLDSVKSRQQPVASAEIGHRTASICHLNNIAMLTGRKLNWDPKAEKFIDDSSADALLKPSMRAPWTL